MPVPCDPSYDALGEAAIMLPPNSVYRLIVGPCHLSYARRVYTRQGDTMISNPLAPFINVELREDFGEMQWELWSGADCVYSEGL
jgi:hypothetical protein